MLDWTIDIKKTIQDLRNKGCSNFHLDWRIWDDYGKSEKTLGYIGYFWWENGLKVSKKVTPIFIDNIKLKNKIQKEFEKENK